MDAKKIALLSLIGLAVAAGATAASVVAFFQAARFSKDRSHHIFWEVNTTLNAIEDLLKAHVSGGAQPFASLMDKIEAEISRLQQSLPLTSFPTKISGLSGQQAEALLKHLDYPRLRLLIISFFVNL